MVGTRAEILRLRPEILADDPDAILMPGLVNSHAHLELTGLPGKIPARMHFTKWLCRVIRKKQEMVSGEISRNIRRGEEALLDFGVTAVADIASFPSALRAPRLLRTIVLREVIGLRSVVCLPRGGAAISPHAPYSLSDENLNRISRWWDRRPNSIVSMHIAESGDETAYFVKGEGLFKKFYEDMKIPARTVPGRRPIAYLDSMRLLRRGLLAVHANDVTAEEARLLAERGVTVAVCPGSLDFFRFPRLGVRRLMAAKVPIVFGTDSAASNRGLNLFRELRLARRFWPMPARRIVESATSVPGEKIWGGSVGKLQRGAFADLILVGAARSLSNPFEDLLAKKAEERIQIRILAGRMMTQTKAN